MGRAPWDKELPKENGTYSDLFGYCEFKDGKWGPFIKHEPGKYDEVFKNFNIDGFYNSWVNGKIDGKRALFVLQSALDILRNRPQTKPDLDFEQDGEFLYCAYLMLIVYKKIHEPRRCTPLMIQSEIEKTSDRIAKIQDGIIRERQQAPTLSPEGKGGADEEYREPAILKNPFLNTMKTTNRSAWEKFNKAINKIMAYNEAKKRFNFMNSNRGDVAFFFKFIGYSQDWGLIAENILFKNEELSRYQLLTLSKPGPSAKWEKEISIPCGF
ncbi:hypothetical protein AGMMS49942_03530 [Spirochaetia bacterium]|nr:hypothetical protein AGMMS49942_03530 [Spirochaetia bacterium]